MKTIEEQVEEFDHWMKKMLCHNGIMDDDRFKWWSEYNKQNLQERDRIAYERGVEDTKIKNQQTIEYYQLRAREEELGNWVDWLEEQITHEIMLGGKNSNKQRMDDYRGIIIEMQEALTTPSDYNKRDHTHCPDTNSPCGIEGEHRCCLCLEDKTNDV